MFNWYLIEAGRTEAKINALMREGEASGSMNFHFL